jgi:hypothetical protein
MGGVCADYAWLLWRARPRGRIPPGDGPALPVSGAPGDGARERRTPDTGGGPTETDRRNHGWNAIPSTTY